MPRLYVIECCACGTRHELQFHGGMPAGDAPGWACVTVYDPNLPRPMPGMGLGGDDGSTGTPVEYLCDKCVKERLPERIVAMIANAEATDAVHAIAGRGRKRAGYVPGA